MACVVDATAFAETEDEARAALARLDDFPLVGRCYERTLYRPSSFTALFDGMDQWFPAQHRYLAHTVGSERGADELLAAIETHVRRPPAPRALILCPIIAPPPAGAPAPPAAAFSIAARTFLMTYAIWDDARADAANHAWHQAVVDTLEPFADCYYIGETNIAARPERAARCFSPANWQRFQSLRRQYDPEGLFRSLVPSGGG
jgi:FAD/FMN-containing dehydrogenase